MEWYNMHSILVIVQHSVSCLGVLIIITGILLAVSQYLYQFMSGKIKTTGAESLNGIRLYLGRVLILGLEFIVAADLIGTTTAPDYYSVGILAIIVLIRTVLSFTINRELNSLMK